MNVQGTGGVSTRNGPLSATRWNPRGLKTNCGFCAISYALEVQKGTLIDADQLYIRTLESLGIDTGGDTDPIPRLLIFPGAQLDEAAIRVDYEALENRGHGPANYTIWSVARLAGLDLKPGNKELLNSMVEFAAQLTPRRWTLDDFVRARMNRPSLAGKASFASMKVHVESELRGNSIIGSVTSQHFVNLAIRPTGEMTVFDPQKGVPYDGARIKADFNRLDLFERITPTITK